MINKIKKAKNLLEEANNKFDKNHFSKVDRAKTILNSIIKEEKDGSIREY